MRCWLAYKTSGYSMYTKKDLAPACSLWANLGKTRLDPGQQKWKLILIFASDWVWRQTYLPKCSVHEFSHTLSAISSHIILCIWLYFFFSMTASLILYQLKTPNCFNWQNMSIHWLDFAFYQEQMHTKHQANILYYEHWSYVQTTWREHKTDKRFFRYFAGKDRTAEDFK